MRDYPGLSRWAQDIHCPCKRGAGGSEDEVKMEAETGVLWSDLLQQQKETNTIYHLSPFTLPLPDFILYPLQSPHEGLLLPALHPP